MVLWLSPAPHREAGGGCARHSGAGAAELTAADCHRTDWEFTLMVPVIASVFRCWNVIEHGSTDPSYYPLQSLSPSSNSVVNLGSATYRSTGYIANSAALITSLEVGDRCWLALTDRKYFNPTNKQKQQQQSEYDQEM